MTKGRRVTALLLLAAALVLAGLGQYYFFRRRDYLWDGLVFHLLAALCFILAWRLSLPRKRQEQERKRLSFAPWLRRHWVPAILLALGTCLSLAATLWSLTAGLGELGRGAVLLWGLAVGAVGLATLWPASGPPSLERLIPTMSRQTWLEAATVAGLTLLALVLRVAALDSVPFTLGGDEAWHGLLARQVLEGNIQNPFSMGYMSMPTFFYWPLSWSLRLAGNDVAGLRLPAALVGTVTVPLLYLFARDLWGKRTAFLAAALLATYDYHIHYSRLGANNVWDPLFVLLALWALDRGLVAATDEGAERQASAYRSFLAVGFVLGLSTYFYTGARLLPLLVIIYVAFVWLKRRRQVGQLGTAVAAASRAGSPGLPGGGRTDAQLCPLPPQRMECPAQPGGHHPIGLAGARARIDRQKYAPDPGRAVAAGGGGLSRLSRSHGVVWRRAPPARLVGRAVWPAGHGLVGGPLAGSPLFPGTDLVLVGDHHRRHADRKPALQPAAGDCHPGRGPAGGLWPGAIRQARPAPGSKSAPNGKTSCWVYWSCSWPWAACASTLSSSPPPGAMAARMARRRP